MASTINASTGPVSGLISTGDNSGQIELQANGATKLTVSSSGVTIPTLVGANINLASNVTGTLPIANGGTGTTSTTFANLATNVTGTLPIANGGTGTTSTTFANLTTNVTGTLPVANGGTGATTLTANNVLLGNGTSALQTVAPGSSGNVLTSNGTTWQSTAPAGGGSWIYISTVTASSSTTADITGFTSTYDMYAIVGTGVYADSSGTNSLFGIRFNFGSGYLETYNYSYWNVSATNNSGQNLIRVNHFQGDFTSTYPINFIAYVGTPANGSGRKNIWGMGNGGNAGMPLIFEGYSYDGSATGALTGVRFFFFNASNIQSGSFRLYGIKNS